MKNKTFKTSNYSCYYNFYKKRNIFLFLNGIGGIKDFFYDFIRYKKNYGYLLVDLPGFGDSKYRTKPKKIIKDHISILKKIFLKEKIQKFNLVVFSLSTGYLHMIDQDLEIRKKIKKVILLDPSLVKNVLNWSIEIFKKNKVEFLKYIKNYKKNIHKIFRLALVKKKKNIKNITKNLIKFDPSILYNLNRECVNIVLKKKVFKLLNKKKDILAIYPKNRKIKKNLRKKFKKIILIENSNHYLSLDNPRKTYEAIINNV